MRRLWSARRARAALMAASLLAGLPAGVVAHPHIWVTYAIVLPLGPQGLEAVQFVWTFDELFSGMILGAGGRGADAPADTHLRTLRAIPHVIEVFHDGAAVELGEPGDLAVSVADHQVTYRFSVPLRRPVAAPGVVDVHVDDPGLFTAFTLRAPNPTEIRSSGPLTAGCDRARLPSGAPGPIRCVLKLTP